MASVTLFRIPIKYLDVYVDKEVYQVPLACSLPTELTASLETEAKTKEFFKKYIPEEIIDKLSRDEYNNLCNTWVEESNQARGMNLGE